MKRTKSLKDLKKGDEVYFLHPNGNFTLVTIQWIRPRKLDTMTTSIGQVDYASRKFRSGTFVGLRATFFQWSFKLECWNLFDQAKLLLSDADRISDEELSKLGETWGADKNLLTSLTEKKFIGEWHRRSLREQIVEQVVSAPWRIFTRETKKLLAEIRRLSSAD